ncbi:MAG: YabP/YqfC family sporulation protein [Bacilli bacterium]|nr:YabP/YqfC family sporulation protein [Bacilli bacterium]
MIRKIKDYILENEFKMIILKDRVDITNYSDIDHFDDNKIIIRHNNGLVVIKGYKLIISKLLEDELLIYGKVENIELR